MTMNNTPVTNAELAIVTIVFQNSLMSVEGEVTADMLQNMYQRDLAFRKKVENALSVKMVSMDRILSIFTLDTFAKLAISLNIARHENVIFYGYKSSIKPNTQLL